MNLLTETRKALVECLGVGHLPAVSLARVEVDGGHAKPAEALWSNVVGPLVRLAVTVAAEPPPKENDRDARRKTDEVRR